MLEIIAISVWHYEKIFFPVLMISFLWAGTAVPFQSFGNTGRWLFLAVGAVVGVIRYFETPERHFSAIHILALLCVLSAVVSALVSIRTQTSLLKAASLLLLLSYGSFGARLAVAGREMHFFRALVTACEFIAYGTGLLYIVLGVEFFGNPNSLGAVMGVVIVPILLWGFVVSPNRALRQRRGLALCLAGYLLYLSLSRAGILAALCAATIMCVATRRSRLLLQGGFVLLLVMTALAVFQSQRFDSLISAFRNDVVYKGKPEEGLLGSRKGPWQETMDSINQNPWFGTGFGTDRTPIQLGSREPAIRTDAGTIREHGSSYLTLLEYVGLLGVIPFFALLVVVIREIYSVCAWMRQSGTAFHYSVPLALICVAGLVHAFFEDWLFAVGYYLCVFFWSSVFMLADLRPHPIHAARQEETLLISAAAERIGFRPTSS